MIRIYVDNGVTAEKDSDTNTKFIKDLFYDIPKNMQLPLEFNWKKWLKNTSLSFYFKKHVFFALHSQTANWNCFLFKGFLFNCI